MQQTIKVTTGHGTLVEAEIALFDAKHDCEGVPLMEADAYAKAGGSYVQYAGDTYDCVEDAMRMALDPKDAFYGKERVECMIRGLTGDLWFWQIYEIV